MEKTFKSNKLSNAPRNLEDDLWRIPPKAPSLAPGEIHVWRASLDVSASRLSGLERFLSAEELTRVDRYHFDRDRNRFVVRRGFLRTILGHYLGAKPDDLEFEYTRYGKPYLGNQFAGDEIRFNLSHSHGLVLYAISLNSDIGVDLELVRPELVSEEIAERFFSPTEVSILHALPEDVQPRAFFNCWTRKEAFVKARGEGLSLPLDQFNVSLGPGEKAALLSTKWDPQEASRWSLLDLNLGSDYIGALAVEGHGWQLRCWRWPDS